MNKYLSMQSVIRSLAIIGAVIVLVTFLLVNREEAEGNAFPGNHALIGKNLQRSYSGDNGYGSTTQQTLTARVPTQIFATSTACVSRTITTTGADITVSVYDGAPVLSQYSGHLQTASTTKDYDAEVYGCGLMRIFAVASTTITASEAQGQ